jgi:peptidoglycan/LPS O-acetylase OafA/YrhL
MLFFGAVYLMLQGETIIGVLKRLAITIPLIQTWLPVGYQAINSVAWYLSVCVFLYFCFPCLLKHIKEMTKTWIPSVAIVIIFLLQLLVGYCVYQYTSIDIKGVHYV